MQCNCGTNQVSPVWSFIANAAAGQLGQWLKTKGEIEERRAVARIEAVSRGIPGYSDELLLIVWGYPMVAAFIPALQPTVTAGFAFLDQLPDWYVVGFCTITAAVFGIDKAFQFLPGRKS